ncbi:hypothetical protein KIS4809_5014 [Bacillus sp. ZZV12-4809]|nr:hypothetical protein KIS4809_5014 [Bacillus sp. ZZV12-4809]
MSNQFAEFLSPEKKRFIIINYRGELMRLMIKKAAESFSTA